MSQTKIKTYSELIELPTFLERFEYLRVGGSVGVETFGSDRYLNQALYGSARWKSFIRSISIRDQGCDLGVLDRPIGGRIYHHHINPITAEDIINRADCIFDPENIISVSFDTHQAIHYGDSSLLIPDKPTIRRPNDTIPWKRGEA